MFGMRALPRCPFGVGPLCVWCWMGVARGAIDLQLPQQRGVEQQFKAKYYMLFKFSPLCILPVCANCCVHRKEQPSALLATRFCLLRRTSSLSEIRLALPTAI